MQRQKEIITKTLILLLLQMSLSFGLIKGYI